MTPTDWLLLSHGGRAERVIPIVGRLHVGRECAGVTPSQHLLLDDAAVSRDHFELRIDASRGTLLVDHSTNGTRVNGRRVERGEPLRLCDGDTIEVGSVRMGFRSLEAPDRVPGDVQATVRALEPLRIASVVGDVADYTALTERNGGRAVATATDGLFAALRELLVAHGGTVANFAGDSIFAAWDAAGDADAVSRAVRFAVAASELVAPQVSGLELGDAGEVPLRMGWGVTLGDAATAYPSPAREAVHGDAINLAFRLSGVAARGGEPAVLVTAEAAAAAPVAARYGALRELRVRGRAAPAQVRAAERAA
jgi:adenylate cyclase